MNTILFDDYMILKLNSLSLILIPIEVIQWILKYQAFSYLGYRLKSY